MVRLGEERGEVVPARLVEVGIDGGAAVAWGCGEEAAGALDFLGMGCAEGDEVFLGVGDGFGKFVGAEEFDVLLEAELEFELALFRIVST